MNVKIPVKSPVFWGVVILLILNILAAGWLIESRRAAQERAHTIGSLYSIEGAPLVLHPVMEAMTAHGSVQYFTSDTDWLYFEQMAGGLRITLGKNAEDVTFSEFDAGGIHYSLAEEPLGSELAWENQDGYLFYLYSSLNADELRKVAACIVMTEGGNP